MHGEVAPSTVQQPVIKATAGIAITVPSSTLGRKFPFANTLAVSNSQEDAQAAAVPQPISPCAQQQNHTQKQDHNTVAFPVTSATGMRWCSISLSSTPPPGAKCISLGPCATLAGGLCAQEEVSNVIVTALRAGLEARQPQRLLTNSGCREEGTCRQLAGASASASASIGHEALLHTPAVRRASDLAATVHPRLGHAQQMSLPSAFSHPSATACGGGRWDAMAAGESSRLAGLTAGSNPHDPSALANDVPALAVGSNLRKRGREESSLAPLPADHDIDASTGAVSVTAVARWSSGAAVSSQSHAPYPPCQDFARQRPSSPASSCSSSNSPPGAYALSSASRDRSAFMVPEQRKVPAATAAAAAALARD